MSSNLSHVVALLSRAIILTWTVFYSIQVAAFGQPASTSAPAINVPTVAESGKKPVPASVNYKIFPDDILEITVFQENDLHSVVRVSNEGAITLPLIKMVPIKGLTTQEAAQAIQERLAKGYLINPQVSVTVVEFSKRKFTVLGQVQRPGSYDLPDQTEITLLQAIALAGGYTRLADLKRVALTRNDEKGRQVLVINAQDMESGKDASLFLIHPNDLISIQESKF